MSVEMSGEAFGESDSSSGKKGREELVPFRGSIGCLTTTWTVAE